MTNQGTSQQTVGNESLWLFLALLGALVSIIFFSAEFADMSLQTVCRVSSVYIVFTFVAGYHFSGRNFWSFSFVYLFVLALFHFGIVLPFAAGLVHVDDIAQGQYWWSLPITPKAIVITTIGFLACGLGIGLPRMFSLWRKPSPSAQLPRATGPVLLSLTGSLLVIASVAYWFYITLSAGGLSVLTGNYTGYLASTQGSSTAYVWLFMGIGICFLAASPPSQTRTIALASFILFAIVALPIGLRGEVLFSGAAALVVLARHRRMPTTKTAILIVLVGLLMISLLREVRLVGVGQILSSEFNPAVAEGLVELGSSLRPVVEVVKWSEEGDPFVNGATYWAPIERAYCGIVHPWECVPAVDDERLMNVLIMNRLGPYGFSPIAEAFRNFGVYGVAVVMFVIGSVVSVLDIRAKGWWREAIASVIYVELLINVRNSFTAVPTHILLGMGLVCAILIFSHFTNTSTSRADSIIPKPDLSAERRHGAFFSR